MKLDNLTSEELHSLGLELCRTAQRLLAPECLNRKRFAEALQKIQRAREFFNEAGFPPANPQ